MTPRLVLGCGSTWRNRFRKSEREIIELILPYLVATTGPTRLDTRLFIFSFYRDFVELR